MKKIILISFLIFVLVPQMALSEITTAEVRPKIGLVLSGGGARGAAHIGVIRRLEELRIPVIFKAA